MDAAQDTAAAEQGREEGEQDDTQELGLGDSDRTGYPVRGGTDILVDLDGSRVVDALDDLDLDDPHAVEFLPLARGGRIEPKYYQNKNGTRRLYYVFRWEEKRNGKRYRPTRYLGKSPTSRLERVGRTGASASPTPA